jgi:hypothetical protein
LKIKSQEPEPRTQNLEPENLRTREPENRH